MYREQRPGASEFAPFYQKYVDLVPDGDIVAILATQVNDTVTLLRELTDQQALSAYAPGKWSIKQVIAHVTDAERVFAYRALRFGRADATPLAGFDENEYAAAAGSDDRPLPSLLAELLAVRGATVGLFAGLSTAAWDRGGAANHQPVTVRALAWIAAGHELHHREILADRYLAGILAR
jgi:hypothetical protein